MAILIPDEVVSGLPEVPLNEEITEAVDLGISWRRVSELFLVSPSIFDIVEVGVSESFSFSVDKMFLVESLSLLMGIIVIWPSVVEEDIDVVFPVMNESVGVKRLFVVLDLITNAVELIMEVDRVVL